MPTFRIVVGTPHGNLKYDLEAVSVAIARQATPCLSGCRVVSVEPMDGGDTAWVGGGRSGPQNPAPLQAHEPYPDRDAT